MNQSPKKRSISYCVSRSRRQYSRLSSELAGWNWPSHSLEAPCRTQSRRSRAFVYPGKKWGWIPGRWLIAGSMLKALGSFLRPSSVEIRGNHSRLNRCTASNRGFVPRSLLSSHPSKNTESVLLITATLAKPLVGCETSPIVFCTLRYRRM